MQTKLLLLNARQDYGLAINILTLVQTNSISNTIEDVMYAYMLAKDWCKRLSNPKNCENDFFDEIDDLTPFIHAFKHHAECLESKLITREHELVIYFNGLNQSIVHLLESKNELVKELTKMHIRTLVYTADFFTIKHSQTWYKEMLERNSFPTIDVL